MENIIESLTEFLSTHWILSTALIILLLAFIINEWASQTFGTRSISPQLLVDWINHSDAKIIDIRNITAFQEGHILNSTHLPFAQIGPKINTLKKFLDKPLVIVCNLGNDATKAADILEKQGFKQVYILQGGLSAWKTAGLPLEKKS